MSNQQKDSSETAVEINFHKFVGVGAGELGMTPCERCGALERDLIHVDKFRKTTGERVPSVHIDDYRNAPSGVGPLASTWKDKPHRLLYDLCKELERARAYSPSSAVEAFDAEIARQAEFGMYPSVDDFRIALRQADSPSVDEATPCICRDCDIEGCNPNCEACLSPLAGCEPTTIQQRLTALLPELEYARETHVQWRDCDQKHRDANPQIGDSEFHAQTVINYDTRLATIKDAIAALRSPVTVNEAARRIINHLTRIIATAMKGEK